MFKKRGFLAIALVLCMVVFAAPAMADVVYTVVDNSYAAGTVGVVAKNASGDLSVTPNVITNLNGDNAVFSFVNADNQPRIMISQYTVGQPDLVWIYDVKAMNGSPLKEVKWENFSNKRAISAQGQYLYAVDYDNANIVRVNMKDETYVQDKYYHFTTDLEGYQTKGESVAAVGGYVYTLFTTVKDPWGAGDYKPSKLVKFDSDLNVVSSADVGKNSVKMTVADGKIYIASIGGKQNYGSYNNDSMLEMVDPDTMAVKTLLKAENMKSQISDWAYDFRDIAVDAIGNVYILAGAYDSYGYSLESRIFKTTLSSLQSGSIGSEFADPSGLGFTWELRYDEKNSELICTAGYQINVYDKDGKVTEIDATQLKGNLYSVAVIEEAKPTPTPSGGSSGGCSAGFAGLALLAFAPLALRSRKKK